MPLHEIFRSGVLVAITAHGLIGISLVWDKVLLEKRETRNLVSYVFWLGAISIFGLVLIPFGFKFPGLELGGIGIAAGLLDLIATYFYYSALKSGQASEELAIMGGFSPVATALISLALISNPFDGRLIGFLLLTAGGAVMFLAERAPLGKVLPMIVSASGCFGLSSVLQRIVFTQANFVTGYVFFTFGTFFGAMCLLAPTSWRRQIFTQSEEANPRSKTLYMLNRLIAGIGSFLAVYAVSLTTPALVEAISGVRYVMIFVGAYAITRFRPSWFQEDFTRRALITKVAATCLVVAGLVLVGMGGDSGSSAGPQ